MVLRTSVLSKINKKEFKNITIKKKEKKKETTINKLLMPHLPVILVNCVVAGHSFGWAYGNIYQVQVLTNKEKQPCFWNGSDFLRVIYELIHKAYL